jgi:tRNA(Ile2) C34 agmatinyltransferase TiaS
MTEPERFTLANRDHLSAVLAVLFATGAMCPVCGYATRRTSKRWARCKRCGERVARRDLETLTAEGELRSTSHD